MIQIEKSPWWKKIRLFQSLHQFQKFALVTIPTLVLVGIVAYFVELFIESAVVIGGLTGAAVGAFIHLLFLFPARLQIDRHAGSEARIRDWLERNGYIESRAGRYDYKKRRLVYEENHFEIMDKGEVLEITGPEFQIMRLRKFLMKERRKEGPSDN